MKLKIFILVVLTTFILSCAQTPTETPPSDNPWPIEPEPKPEPKPEPEPDPGPGWEDCSSEIGNHACDLILLDQDGSEFRLYDHYGDVIVLDFSVMWCGPCQAAAAVAQYHQDYYEKDGVVYATVLIENFDRDDPTQDNLLEWWNHFGMTTCPVLGSSRDLLEEWPLTGWPTFYFIDRDMVVREVMRGWSEGLLVQNIEALL